MVSVLSLLVPILVSAVLVFLASFVIHMLLPYHRNDFGQLAREDDVMAALRPFNIPAGDYLMPCVRQPSQMRDPAFLEKRNKGPVAIVTVFPAGPPTMTTQLILWFLYSIGAGVFSAYLSGRALAPGAPYLEVFRFAGTTAFLAYAYALMHDSIWYGRNWRATTTMLFDGLVYALLTAGVFGWLWPSA
jgi:hypothetical protein